eukprot:327191-Chlamydomonas_euryale.AAC.1
MEHCTKGRYLAAGMAGLIPSGKYRLTPSGMLNDALGAVMGTKKSGLVSLPLKMLLAEQA